MIWSSVVSDGVLVLITKRCYYLMLCGLGVAEKMKIMLSAAAPAALLDYLLQNAGSTWLSRCQDLASCPRVAGPPGPSRISRLVRKLLERIPNEAKGYVYPHIVA